MEKFNVRLQSENIDYVDVSEALIPDYLKMINNYNIAKLLSSKIEIYTYEDELNWVHRSLEDKAVLFSMIERNSQRFIGNVELMDVTETTAEIGIALDEDFQGRHYGTEALKTVINYAFNELKLQELNLVVFSNNERAIRCYEKLGFEKYKVEQNVAVIDNMAVDDVYMKLKK